MGLKAMIVKAGPYRTFPGERTENKDVPLREVDVSESD